MLRGEPGIGKTLLLDDLVSLASDALVLRTQGVEAEAPFAFAALHRLFRPVMRLRDQLPPPQASALRRVFGEEEGPAVEPFLVAIATLSLISSAAEEAPVLLVVDDAHWLDRASAEALLFAARRLGADRAAMVFAARDAGVSVFDAAGLPELRLGGLDTAQARLLLGDQVGDVAAARLVAETGGNPLALLELPAGLTPEQLEGSAPLPEALPLTSQVQRAFVERSRGLSTLAQAALLVVCSDDTGEPELVRRAARRLGADEAQWSEAAGSGLVDSVGRLRHPLVRSALHQAASRSERDAAHLALAETLEERGDLDHATWHRAAATEGPDDALADALSGSALLAERRGGYDAAMRAYRRASMLATDPQRVAGLTLAAARTAFMSGHVSDTRTLLVLARETATDPILICDIARLRGRIEVNMGSATQAHRLFVHAAADVAAVDGRRALELASAAGLLSAYGADSGARLDLTALETNPSDADDPRTRCLKHMVLAMSHAGQSDWPAALESGRAAFEAGDSVDDADVLGNLGNVALAVGADEEQRRFYERMLSRSREQGAALSVIYALDRLGFSHIVGGDLAALRSASEECLSLSASVSQPALSALPRAWLALLAALQGHDDVEVRLTELDAVLAAHPLGILSDPVHDVMRWARGASAAAAGDAQGSLHHLGLIRLPVIARMATVDRIDAAVRANDLELAATWTVELAGYAEGTGHPWARAALAYSRAMTAAPGAEEEQFTLALEHHAQASRSLDRARTHLAYGEWLRRVQRRVDSRTQLRQALDIFRDQRAEGLADRAERELRASGETARKRDPSTLVKLTPMELKIAQLVSSGMSNKDVAAQCWVSPRTVAFHLRNVFAKAGVTSRGELAQLQLG